MTCMWCVCLGGAYAGVVHKALRTYTHIHTQIHTHKYIHKYTHINTYTNTHTNIHTNTCLVLSIAPPTHHVCLHHQHIVCVTPPTHRFEELVQVGVVPNIITYNTLLKSCMRCSDANRAAVLWSDMQRQGVGGDAYTYTMLIKVRVGVLGLLTVHHV